MTCAHRAQSFERHPEVETTCAQRAYTFFDVILNSIQDPSETGIGKTLDPGSGLIGDFDHSRRRRKGSLTMAVLRSCAAVDEGNFGNSDGS